MSINFIYVICINLNHFNFIYITYIRYRVINTTYMCSPYTSLLELLRCHLTPTVLLKFFYGKGSRARDYDM